MATLCASSLALPCYTGCSGGGGGYSGGGAHIQGGSQSATIVGPTDPGATIVGPSSQAHIVGPTDPGATIVGPGSQANVVGPDGAHISANEVGGKIIAQPKQGRWVYNVKFFYIKWLISAGSIQSSVSPGYISVGGGGSNGYSSGWSPSGGGSGCNGGCGGSGQVYQG